MANINVQLKTFTIETSLSGLRGKSAYESWLSEGNVGTESDFVTAMLQDATFVFTQQAPASEWTITHNLNKFPAVTIVDSAESVVYGEIQYLTNNSVKISFTAEFSGKAYLN